MSEIIGFDNIKDQIITDLSSNKDILLFAFNATGKTRLSCSFENTEDIIETLSYNAIVEDYFTWDNEEKVMSFRKDTWLFSFIRDEGLEKDIAFYFEEFTDEKIDSIINFETGEIKFEISDNSGERISIKISKGEESLFKWSVFYTALKRALDILNEKPENRSTTEFNQLKYIVIDDPMSSLDEFKIYTLSMQLLELIKYVHEKEMSISFLITTHHVMFYNILYNTMRNRSGNKKLFYIMQKRDTELVAESIGDKKPITYHIKTLTEIKNAFEANKIEKHHFNMFRSTLEKSSIFLGYANWQELFEKYENKDELNKIVNMNSHEQYVELETEYLTQEQIDKFKNGFDYFIATYKIKL